MSKENLLKEDDYQKSNLLDSLSMSCGHKDESISKAILQLVKNSECTKGEIIDFFQNHELLTNFNKDEYYYDYGHLVVNAVSQIIKSIPNAINILEHVLSLKPNDNMDRAYLCSEIIFQLVQFPEGYKKINYILQEIIDNGLLAEDLNDMCDISEQNSAVLKEYFRFIPVSETLPLIEDNIDGVNPVISNILKKVHTNMSIEDREKLKINLAKDLGNLIDDKWIKLLLTKAGDCISAVNIHSEGGGAGYLNGKIDINGAKEYVNDRDKYLIPSTVIHESLHFYMDNLFKNDSNPFKEGDLNSLAVWKKLEKRVYDILVENAGVYNRVTEAKPTQFASIEYNAYGICSYKEDLRVPEIPAFYVQDIAIRILATKADEKMKDSILVQQFPEIAELIQGIFDNSAGHHSVEISLNGDSSEVYS